MMRKQPGPPPEVTPQERTGVITQEREYTLITPLFGGGAVAGERDAVTIVRGTEVRGMLRFWWRACYGGRYEKVKDMKDAEDQLWGKAHKKGELAQGTEETIQIEVEPIEIQKVKELPAFTQKEGKQQPDADIPIYAAFPLQPNDKKPTSLIYKNVCFCLTISFPVGKQVDIEGALWAWETFGGIGARTRRGFGALCLEKAWRIRKADEIEVKEEIQYTLPVCSESDVRTWIECKFAEFGIDKKAVINIPCLSSEVHFEVVDFHENVRMTWKGLIDALSSFRQKRSGSSQNRRGNFGRSQWPEAEAIREITSGRLPHHPHKFPRAAFGLPINFHFPDKRDPEDVTLQGPEKGHDRFASPLILRPLCCQNNKVIGLAVVLENYALPDKKLILKETKSGKEHSVSAKLESNEVKDVSPLDGEANVLKAFMQHLRISSQKSDFNNNRERKQ